MQYDAYSKPGNPVGIVLYPNARHHLISVHSVKHNYNLITFRVTVMMSYIYRYYII